MVYYVDGVPGMETLAVHRRLASHIRFNLKQEYSKICGFVWDRMSLAIVRSNSLLLQGAWYKKCESVSNWIWGIEW